MEEERCIDRKRKKEVDICLQSKGGKLINPILKKGNLQKQQQGGIKNDFSKI
jgi:hypothetical protein